MLEARNAMGFLHLVRYFRSLSVSSRYLPQNDPTRLTSVFQLTTPVLYITHNTIVKAISISYAKMSPERAKEEDT
jgi:hypothetical protein